MSGLYYNERFVLGQNWVKWHRRFHASASDLACGQYEVGSRTLSGGSGARSLLRYNTRRSLVEDHADTGLCTKWWKYRYWCQLAYTMSVHASNVLPFATETVTATGTWNIWFGHTHITEWPMRKISYSLCSELQFIGRWRGSHCVHDALCVTLVVIPYSKYWSR